MESNNNQNGQQNSNGVAAPNQTQGQAPPQGQGYYNYGYYPYYYPPQPPQRKKSDKPKIAGGLLIVAGILGLIMAGMMVVGGTFMGNMDMMEMGDWGQVDINGVVLAADGSPIDNATLTVEGTHIMVITDILGNYQMMGVPAGHQEITVEKAGYNTIVRHVYIIPEASSTMYNVDNQFVIVEDTELNFNMTLGSETFIYGDDADVYAMEGFESILITIGVIFALCSVGSLVAGYYALMTKKYPLVIIGAIVGIFSVGFAIGSILAVAALFILLLASDDFKMGENGEFRE